MGQGRRPVITPAKTAGFCFGVDRAVNMVYDACATEKNVCTLGPIIHNNFIIDDLASKGVRTVNDPSEVRENDTLIIRAHGVSESIMKQLEDRHIKYLDATCPFVKKIHRIVAENTAAGKTALIAGDENHPEIIGIRGHCKGPSYVFNSARELEQLLHSHPDLAASENFLVSQTTFSVEEWEKCVKIVNLICTNTIIFDTICNATEKRQAEARELSEKSDLMIVIGSAQSSNTLKLKNVCESNCRTVLIESAADLSDIDISGCTSIGVTAGASTPVRIIKEVLETMSETKDENEMSFEEALEESLRNMSTDQKVKGVVVGITPTEIEVDIGRKHAGYIPFSEYSYDTTIDPAKEVKVGDEIDCIILKTNDLEGTVMLSKKRFDSVNAWSDIEAANENGTIMEGTVTDVIKGGLLVTTLLGVRVFIPASQSTMSRNDPLEPLLHTKVQFKIIEVNPHKKRAVGSIKEVLRESRKEASQKFFDEAKVGDTYTGVVKSMTKYGAFVDIGGVDGMIHISELSWKHIKDPSDVLNIGDTVEVYIKSLDNDRISLGYKKDEDNPWAILKKTYNTGDVIDVKVVGLTQFGAFANVIDGIDGLIHVSQISDRHIEKPDEVLKVGDTVKVKITDIDYDKKRVSLSMKALIEKTDDEEENSADKAAPVENSAE